MFYTQTHILNGFSEPLKDPHAIITALRCVNELSRKSEYTLVVFFGTLSPKLTDSLWCHKGCKELKRAIFELTATLSPRECSSQPPLPHLPLHIWQEEAVNRGLRILLPVGFCKMNWVIFELVMICWNWYPGSATLIFRCSFSRLMMAFVCVWETARKRELFLGSKEIRALVLEFVCSALPVCGHDGHEWTNESSVSHEYFTLSGWSPLRLGPSSQTGLPVWWERSERVN